ncbi:MAG TPA: hypothetical protein ENK18_12165 [Deltaproteobacteria bacterium]|nr:hypothetical protein [Deltaproteobacteria bacterium]
MAHQPLIPCVLPPLLLVVSAGCPNPEPYGGAFDVPIAVAVLQPELGGPFQEPVGFVANGHGGQIVQLALKQGRFLTDDPTASFLRTHQLATGDDRLLTSLAIYAPDTTEVTVFAGDRAFGRLLRVPYLIDCDADEPGTRLACERGDRGPVESRAFIDEPSIVKPDSVTFAEIGIKTGYTTTETWTLTYDGETWLARGSRSGLQAERLRWGEPWSAADRRLQLTLEGAATSGDQIVLKTHSGLSEHDVGGAPLALAMAPDQSLLAMIVHDRIQDRPHLWWFDPATRERTTQVALPADAHPHRLSWSEGGTLLITDRVLPVVHLVEAGEADARQIELPWPTLDADGLDTAAGSRLFVVPLDGLSLWLVDELSGELLDVNGSVPGPQGMTFTTPIQGIEAMHEPYLMPEYTQDGIRRTGRSVAISLASGDIVFAHEQTGCLVQDNLGPRTKNSGFSGSDDYDPIPTSTLSPLLETNGSSDRHVVVNGCAGIAKEEIWTLTYDQLGGSWRVSGSLSGDQQLSAREDERYVSDQGEISFTVRAGVRPSRDGTELSFAIEEGLAKATGDLNGDLSREVSILVSGDPVYFFYRVGLAGPVGDSSGQGWYPVDVRPFVLVPGSSSNEVGRVDPQEALIEVGWD